MKPDYDKSIVNLMSSIVTHFQGKSRYRSLGLKLKKKVVLIVIDGLGADIARKEKFFSDDMHDTITSVFPATTTAAITSFATALSPKEHGMISWFMNTKEYAGVSIPLRFCPRFGGEPYYEYGFDPYMLFDFEAAADKMKCGCDVIVPLQISDTPYTIISRGKSKIRSYKSIKGMFDQIKRSLHGKSPRFVYTYYADYDSVCHEYGKKSDEASILLKKIKKEAGSFLKKVKDATIIITADHGMVDTSRDKVIVLEDDIEECLSMPLCGEKRAAICYVRADKVKEFKMLVRKKLKNKCILKSSGQMIKEGYFGTGKEHRMLRHRIGDFILLAKDNHVFENSLPGQKRKYHIGNHGGTGKEEMEVPLILIQK